MRAYSVFKVKMVTANVATLTFEIQNRMLYALETIPDIVEVTISECYECLAKELQEKPQEEDSE